MPAAAAAEVNGVKCVLKLTLLLDLYRFRDPDHDEMPQKTDAERDNASALETEMEPWISKAEFLWV